MTATEHSSSGRIPVIDVSALFDPLASPADADATARHIDAACRTRAFFGIVGHGVEAALQRRLEALSRSFFALATDEKASISMERAGRAWRGWFPVGGELTAGVADHKEGLYFGAEHADDHPRVVSGTPLHGRNLFPRHPAGLGPVVLDWLDEMHRVADGVMRGVAHGLGLPVDWFADNLTGDPTVLFRIFSYPPGADGWGVAEHTDYGLLTILAQDATGGLEVATTDGSWTPVAPQPGVFVCNIGDMLERLTDGRYRSTAHRVRNSSGHARLSFPYFFDPSWDATVPVLPLAADAQSSPRPRWDGGDVLAWHGTYGEYLTAKVARVFPTLMGSAQPH